MKSHRGGDDSTRSKHADQQRVGHRPHPGEPRYVVSLTCLSPLVDGEIISLAHADELLIGRGPGIRMIVPVDRRIVATIPDIEMSRQHAALRRAMGAWHVEDTGSKNGTLVNGEPVVRQALDDGDLIETGSTVSVFRESAVGTRAAGSRSEVEPEPEPISWNGSGGSPVFYTLSLPVQHELCRVKKVAPVSVPVLVQGETGTGKELIAKAVHHLSGRPGKFVDINSGSIPESLIESELFGCMRGAFTGATHDRLGAVRSAQRGTLFLDEIGDLPVAAQGALLRVLQEHVVVPLGTNERTQVDVRVVAATNRDLAAMVKKGEFREDLYARLGGFELTLPPLRDRREDIGILISALLRKHGGGTAGITIHSMAARALFTYSYPRNVRELELALRTALALARGGQIQLEDLPAAIQDEAAAEADSSVEKAPSHAELLTMLNETGVNIAEVGRITGKAPTQVRRWTRRYGIDLVAMRRAAKSKGRRGPKK